MANHRPKRTSLAHDPRATDEPIYPHQINIWISLLRYAAIAAALRAMYVSFAPLVPAGILAQWALPVSLFMAVWALVIPAMYARRPAPHEIISVWRPIGKILLVGTIVSIVAMIWMFLPYATDALRLMVVVFAMGYVATAVISTAEHTGVNRAGIVAILGSIIV